MNSLGEYIKEVRKKRSLTTSQVAEAVGLSQGYISHIENGRKIPTNEVFNKLSTVLGVPVIELLMHSGQVKSFGQTINELRESWGWTIDELEKKTLNFDYGKPIHIKKNKLTNFENGTDKNPSIFEIYLLSEAFGEMPSVFITVDLQTPKKELEELEYSNGEPNPFTSLEEMQYTLYKKIAKEPLQENRFLINSQIIDLQNEQKKFISQLNELSVNGEVIIVGNEYIGQQTNNNNAIFEEDLTNEHRISFYLPRNLSKKEAKVSFFDIDNLWTLSENKLNYKGQFLSNEQKDKITSYIQSLLKED